MYVNGSFDIHVIFVQRLSMVTEQDTRIITPMPKALVAKIDDYRFQNRIPSRAEAIRRLVEAGLSASAD